jgi:hypothetical protein
MAKRKRRAGKGAAARKAAGTSKPRKRAAGKSAPKPGIGHNQPEAPVPPIPSWQQIDSGAQVAHQAAAARQQKFIAAVGTTMVDPPLALTAAACAPGVGRPCYRFTRPGEMPTPHPAWSRVLLERVPRTRIPGHGNLF